MALELTLAPEGFEGLCEELASKDGSKAWKVPQGLQGLLVHPYYG